MSDSSYNQFCPVAMAAEILGARWTLVLLRELVVGSTRFNDLRRGVPRMSPALLSKRLKDLETAGIVARSPVVGEPGVFEYRLTEAGRELKPVVEAIGCWGQRWIDIEASLEKLDPNLLMWDMRRNIDPKPMPQCRNTIQVIFTDLPQTRRNWWLVVEPGQEVDLCSVDPGFRRRSLSVDRLADHDRDLDGLHRNRPGQGAGQASRHRQQAARG
jgi:DNA-binding HxlR family transcriptional regulator